LFEIWVKGLTSLVGEGKIERDIDKVMFLQKSVLDLTSIQDALFETTV
jgi:hypothetical protein